MGQAERESAAMIPQAPTLEHEVFSRANVVGRKISVSDRSIEFLSCVPAHKNVGVLARRAGVEDRSAGKKITFPAALGA